ncbi:hypothetical protein JCM10212_000374 [Sporobolomyces blumeae]
MEGDDAPATSIKKRKGPSKVVSKLSFDASPDDSAHLDPSPIVIRSRAKGKGASKPPAGKISSAAELTRPESLEDNGQDGPETVVKRSTVHRRPTATSTQSSSSLSTKPTRSLRVPPPPPSTFTPSIPTVSSDAAVAPSSSSVNVYSKEYLDELKRGQLSRTATATETDGQNSYDELTRSKFASSGMDIMDAEPETLIPTSSTISQAKQRREDLRKAQLVAERNGQGGGDGYISLNDGIGARVESQIGFASKGGESRLVREEDELGDGDEDLAAYTGANETIPLGRSANKIASLKLRSELGELIDEVEMEDGDGDGGSADDDDMRKWEDELVRRGDQGRSRKQDGDNKSGAKTAYRPAPIPQSSTVPSLASVTSRLATSLSTLTSSHELDQSSLDHFVRERDQLDGQEAELREEVDKVERKLRWFTEMRDRVEVWAAFLDEKFPALERIEAEYVAIQRERYKIASSRRYADDSDDVSQFTGMPTPIDFKLAADKKLEGDQDRMDRERVAEEERDLDPRSVARSTRRAERERRWRERSPRTTRPSATFIDDPGYDSDTSLTPGDQSDLSDAVSSLREQLGGLFSDVTQDEFRDPNLEIRRRFEEWRKGYREEYEAMFAGLGLVGVWEFWARVEMVGWNPFEIDQLAETPSDLSQYVWHQALTAYGHRHTPDDMHDDDDAAPGNDESAELVNALVSSVIIPRLERLATEAYDPVSLKQTLAAVRIVDEVSYCVETSSPKFEALVQAFLSRLRLAITASQSLVLPHVARLSVPSIAFDPSTFEARNRFLSRQVKVLESCSKWRRFMKSLRIPVKLRDPARSAGGKARLDEGDVDGADDEPGIAAGEGFDQLVQRELVGLVIVPLVEASWATGGAEIGQKVLALLPKDIPAALRRRLEGEQA